MVRRLPCGHVGESRLGERRQPRVHLGDRLATVAAAGGNALGHLGMLEEEAQQLAGSVPGPTDNCDVHPTATGPASEWNRAPVCHASSDCRTMAMRAGASCRAL